MVGPSIESHELRVSIIDTKSQAKLNKNGDDINLRVYFANTLIQ